MHPDKFKAHRLTQLGKSVAEVEGFLELFCIKYPSNIAPTVNQGEHLAIRLSNRLNNDYTEEQMNDILLTANAMLTLKYLIFCDHGLKFHKLHILWQLDNFYYDHPDIKILDTTNDDTLVIMGREAVNTITALHHKYPY